MFTLSKQSWLLHWVTECDYLKPVKTGFNLSVRIPGSLILLASFLFILVSCSSSHHYRVLEKRGDQNLKNLLVFSDDVFIGRAMLKHSEKQAIEQAVYDAKKQIAQRLGVDVEVELSEYFKESEKLISYSTEAFIRVQAEHFIQIKPESIYIEKVKPRDKDIKGTFYNSYVLIRYPYQQTMDLQLELIGSFSRRMRNVINQLQKESFCVHKARLLIGIMNDVTAWEQNAFAPQALNTFREYHEFEQLYREIQNYLAKLNTGLIIELVQKNGKFGTTYLVQVRYNDFMLDNFTVSIYYHEEREFFEYITDSQGSFVLNRPEDSRKAFFLAGNSALYIGKDLNYQEYNILSPFDKRQIKLFVLLESDYDASYFKSLFSSNLLNNGYRITKNLNESDFMVILSFSTVVSERRISGSYIASSLINVQLVDTEGKVLFNSSVYEDEINQLKGFGSTKLQAAANSLLPDNLVNRGFVFRTISTEINKAVNSYIQRNFLEKNRG